MDISKIINSRGVEEIIILSLYHYIDRDYLSIYKRYRINIRLRLFRYNINKWNGVKMKVKNFIQAKLDTGDYQQNYRLAMELGLGSATMSHYLTGHTKQPALEWCAKIYQEEGIVIWPYSEEALNEFRDDIKG